MKKGLTILAVVVMVGVGLFQVGIKLASRDIPPPDESFFNVERLEVAPEDNAYTYFLQATNVLQPPEQPELMTQYLNDIPVDPAAVQEVAESNSDCFSLIQRGTDCSICQMPPLEDFQTVFPYIHPWLEIAKVNALRAQYFRLSGDFRTATDACILEMKFGNLVHQNAPSLIVYLVGVAVVEMGLAQVLDLATDPGMPEQELARLAVALEKPVSFDRGFSRALKSEYLYTTSVIDYMQKRPDELASLSGNEEPSAFMNIVWNRFPGTSYFFQPNKSKQVFADFYRVMIEDTPLLYSEMELPDTVEDSGGLWTLLRPNGISRLLQALLEPAVDKVMAKKCFMESRVAGAQLVVACNRFEREKGRCPESLQDLVPTYLAAVPIDPFDGEPFRYSAEKGIVYSVGQNLTDEGGSMRVEGSEDEVPTRRNRRKAEDMVYEIRPAAKPDESN